MLTVVFVICHLAVTGHSTIEYSFVYIATKDQYSYNPNLMMAETVFSTLFFMVSKFHVTMENNIYQYY